MRDDLDLAAVEVELARLVSSSSRRFENLAAASGSAMTSSGFSMSVLTFSPAAFISSSVTSAGSPSKSGSANSRVALPV